MWLVCLVPREGSGEEPEEQAAVGRVECMETVGCAEASAAYAMGGAVRRMLNAESEIVNGL